MAGGLDDLKYRDWRRIGRMKCKFQTRTEYNSETIPPRRANSWDTPGLARRFTGYWAELEQRSRQSTNAAATRITAPAHSLPLPPQTKQCCLPQSPALTWRPSLPHPPCPAVNCPQRGPPAAVRLAQTSVPSLDAEHGDGFIQRRPADLRATPRALLATVRARYLPSSRDGRIPGWRRWR